MTYRFAHIVDYYLAVPADCNTEDKVRNALVNYAVASGYSGEEAHDLRRRRKALTFAVMYGTMGRLRP